MITYLLTPGGSGNGINDALKRMRCPRMAWYEQQDKLNSPPSIGHGGQLCGTIFHAFAEIYASTGDCDPDNVTLTLPEGMDWPHDIYPEYTEAARVFRAHRARYKPHFGGTLVGTEVPLQLGEFTAKIDAIFDLPENNELNLPPGRWIIDYKCLNSFGPASSIEYSWSGQVAWYRHIYETTQNQALTGAAFLIWTKTKEPKSHVVVAEEWSAEAKKELFDAMETKISQKRTFNCTNKYGTCAFVRRCLKGI